MSYGLYVGCAYSLVFFALGWLALSSQLSK